MQERTINAPVEVDLGGGKLNLVFDMDAMITLEEAGLGGDALSAEMSKAPFTTIRTLIHVGARRVHSELQRAEIGRMVDLRQLKRIADEVTGVLRANLGELGNQRNPPSPPAGV